jgi:hypothetical protein
MSAWQLIEGANTSAIFGSRSLGYETKNELRLDHQAVTNYLIRNS